ncbi:MAG: hypothetical protein WDN45_16985, partial [Caulobacteraceae bacterium]
VIDGAEMKVYETEILPEITADRGAPGGGAGGQTFQSPQGGGGGGGGRHGGGAAVVEEAAAAAAVAVARAAADRVKAGPGNPCPRLWARPPTACSAKREPVASADLNLNSRITLANFKTKAASGSPAGRGRKGYLVLAELPKTAVERQGAEARAGSSGWPARLTPPGI